MNGGEEYCGILPVCMWRVLSQWKTCMWLGEPSETMACHSPPILPIQTDITDNSTDRQEFYHYSCPKLPRPGEAAGQLQCEPGRRRREEPCGEENRHPLPLLLVLLLYGHQCGNERQAVAARLLGTAGRQKSLLKHENSSQLSSSMPACLCMSCNLSSYHSKYLPSPPSLSLLAFGMFLAEGNGRRCFAS